MPKFYDKSAVRGSIASRALNNYVIQLVGEFASVLKHQYLVEIALSISTQLGYKSKQLPSGNKKVSL